MTVLERLRAAGAADNEALGAAAAIGGAIPVGRAFVVTEEILHAAREGDQVLLAALLAEEVELDDERAALCELDGHPELRETMPLETVKTTLGL
jgi:hypothetical protein